MLAVALRLVLVALVATAVRPDAVRARTDIPAEPRAQLLTEDPIFDAVAADVHGDDGREVVALIRSGSSAMQAAVWQGSAAGWEPIGDPIEIQPRAITGEQGAVRWGGTPARLLVRAIDGQDRVTVVRQPIFDEPNLEAPCCLLLHDLVVASRRLQLVAVSEPLDAVDAVHVLDLDGDGVDELVATRSRQPLGDTSFPTDATVLRWDGERFRGTFTELRIGSGDTPFILGDSDGRPGAELGIIATLGRPALYRISLRPGDALGVEDAGIVAQDVAAVPIAEGRGVAIVDSRGELTVRPWQADGALGAAVAGVTVGPADILGVLPDPPARLVVSSSPPSDSVGVLRLPGLAPAGGGALEPSAAAAAFASGPVVPYVGPVPGGDREGRAALIYRGRLLMAGSEGPRDIAALPGVRPIGLVGDGASIALLSTSGIGAALDRRGGRLDPSVPLPGSTLTVAPLALVLTPEADEGRFEPSAIGGQRLADGRIAVGPDGFRARIDGPPGSRVYLSAADPSVISTITPVPDDAMVEVSLLPPDVPTPGTGHRFLLGVTTPAGHGYRASWDVRVIDGPPPLTATAETRIGAGYVVVRGETASYATVRVGGTEVDVAANGRFQGRVPTPPWPTLIAIVARDPIGYETTISIEGVGWFDVRGLPWPWIVALLVGAGGAVLFLRVPRGRPAPVRAADDDATFEEIDPD